MLHYELNYTSFLHHNTHIWNGCLTVLKPSCHCPLSVKCGHLAEVDVHVYSVIPSMTFPPPHEQIYCIHTML